MSEVIEVKLRIKPLAGHSIVPPSPGGYDVDTLVVDDTNERRNALVDRYAVTSVLRDLFDGRLDMASTSGYQTMWELEVVDDGL